MNGQLAGAQDQQHAGVTLAKKAVPGEKFDIVAEAYAGHDRELPVFGQSRLVIVREEVYQFFIDLEALFQLHSGLDPDSLRVADAPFITGRQFHDRRLYEAKGSSTRCTLILNANVTKACETDMLEEEIVQELAVSNGRIALSVRPFEVKTVKLSSAAP